MALAWPSEFGAPTIDGYAVRPQARVRGTPVAGGRTRHKRTTPLAPYSVIGRWTWDAATYATFVTYLRDGLNDGARVAAMPLRVEAGGMLVHEVHFAGQVRTTWIGTAYNVEAELEVLPLDQEGVYRIDLTVGEEPGLARGFNTNPFGIGSVSPTSIVVDGVDHPLAELVLFSSVEWFVSFTTGVQVAREGILVSIEGWDSGRPFRTVYVNGGQYREARVPFIDLWDYLGTRIGDTIVVTLDTRTE